VNRFDSSKDYYAELGVRMSASPEQIERAYRNQARRRHPDRGGSEEEMKSLNEAHDVLADPETRKAYDESRPQPLPRAEAANAFDPYAASKAGTLGIPVSDPDFAGLVMGALACLGLGVPLLLLVEMQWVFVLWPLRLMSMAAIGIGIFLSHSALRAKHRRLKALNPRYPLGSLRLQLLLFWMTALALVSLVVLALYIA
jgi:hypothetical protein